jgi:integrase
LGRSRLERQGRSHSYGPVPTWVKNAVDSWAAGAGLSTGRVFRAVDRFGGVWGEGLTDKVVWLIVRDAALKIGVPQLAPHDLRRTCARLCYLGGGELEQIQFLLGHVSVQTTERYLGCKQKLKEAVNDRIGLEP